MLSTASHEKLVVGNMQGVISKSALRKTKSRSYYLLFIFVVSKKQRVGAENLVVGVVEETHIVLSKIAQEHSVLPVFLLDKISGKK